MSAAGVENGANGSAGAHHAPGAVAGWTTGELALRLGAELLGPSDLRITRLDTLERADASAMTFIRDARHAPGWTASRASAAIVSRGLGVAPGPGRALLVVDDADHALIDVLDTLTPRAGAPEPGAHPSAVVDPAAEVHASARVGPGAVIGPRAVVGARALIHANVTIGADARVGADTELRPGVVIEDRCVVGARVRIHANAVIGADGFGYRPAPGGAGLLKVPHVGHVEIGDDVEIGANSNIDRGKFGPTVIGQGTKIDNLVQIGHNVRVGRWCIICGACGISGSVTIGDGAILAGGVGVADNVAIGAGARIGARSGVMHDIPDGEEWLGHPAAPHRLALRIIAAQRRLPDALARLKRRARDGGE